MQAWVKGNAMIASTAIIYPNVQLGENVTIEDFCIIGTPPKGFGPGELETKIGDNAVIRSHTVMYAGNIIGNNFQTGNKANIRESNNIGNNVSIGTLSVVEHHVNIEDNVRIHTQVFIPEYSKLCDGCWIGPNVVLTNAKFPQSPNVKNELKGPTVSKGAIVGANTTLMPGVNVGREAIIGSGSVVVRDVEERDVVVGNPAKKIKTRGDLPY